LIQINEARSLVLSWFKIYVIEECLLEFHSDFFIAPVLAVPGGYDCRHILKVIPELLLPKFSFGVVVELS
jgi:hypothetical protein